MNSIATQVIRIDTFKRQFYYDAGNIDYTKKSKYFSQSNGVKQSKLNNETFIRNNKHGIDKSYRYQYIIYFREPSVRFARSHLPFGGSNSLTHCTTAAVTLIEMAQYT